MQENFNFWYKAFRSAPRGSKETDPDTIHFFDAFSRVLLAVQPKFRFSSGDIKIWFHNQEFDPDALNHPGQNRAWFEGVLQKFEEKELPTKGGFDLVAMTYEFAGILLPASGKTPAFLSEPIWQGIQNHRLLYPAASLALAVSGPKDDFDWQKEKKVVQERVGQIVSKGATLIEHSAETAKNNTIDEITAESAKFQETIQSALQKIRDEMTAASKEEIEQYKREAGATLVVNNAHTLWSDKARNHRKFFIWSAVSFVVVMLMAIALPVWNWSLISKEILKLEPLFEGHIFGAIVLLLIPVLGVAWILRLLSRFTTQNMMLADDAQLRRVMAETYVKLVSEGAIEDPADRAIILSALFRPLPGSNTEDVSPPSITDILKAK